MVTNPSPESPIAHKYAPPSGPPVMIPPGPVPPPGTTPPPAGGSVPPAPPGGTPGTSPRNRPGKWIIALIGGLLAAIGLIALVTVIAVRSAGDESSPPPPAAITFTISDELTSGALEETIYVSLEGRQVAVLKATTDTPIVTQQVDATEPGNYEYVLDAQFVYLDDDNNVQTQNATGRGSIFVDDGMRFDVYLHEEDDGVSLSLQAAG